MSRGADYTQRTRILLYYNIINTIFYYASRVRYRGRFQYLLLSLLLLLCSIYVVVAYRSSSNFSRYKIGGDHISS